jgi:hypothetical protein
MVAREGEDRLYTEQLLRLPMSYLTFAITYPVPPVTPPPCLSTRALTFGSLASQYKITPQVLDAWAEILRRTPDTRLLLANSTLKSPHNASPSCRAAKRNEGSPAALAVLQCLAAFQEHGTAVPLDGGAGGLGRTREMNTGANAGLSGTASRRGSVSPTVPTATAAGTVECGGAARGRRRAAAVADSTPLSGHGPRLSRRTPSATFAALLAAFLSLEARMYAAAAAEPLQPLPTASDRGNREASAYITGPAYPIAGFANDDLEISLWNGPSPLAFSLAKNDVWDRRYFGDRRKPVDIDDMHRMCFGGTITPENGPFPASTPQALYLAYDFPCPKPVGQLVLRCPDLDSADWSAGRAADDSVVTHASKGDARAEVTTFLCRTRNLFVLRGAYAGLTQPLQVQLFRHQDTTPQGTSIAGIAHYGGNTRYDYGQDPDNGPLPHPEAGEDGRFFWIRQTFPAEKTFPDGFEYVLMGTLVGQACQLSAENRSANLGVPSMIHPVDAEAARRLPGYHKELRIAAERVNGAPSGSLATAAIAAPGGAFDLFLTVVTTRDSATPLANARQTLNQALAEGAAALALASLTAAEEARRHWRNSRVMHYNATSCSFMDSTPWHGDYHFNEGYFTHDIVAGRADRHEQRLRLFEDMLPALQANARDVYHCRGAAFSLVHYPIRSERVVYSNYTWEWGLENTALMLQPFWQIYQYTQDLDFLHRRAYPMLVEGARFYADYVKQGEDGLYHVIPTVSQEHWGWTAEWTLNRDSVGALSFVRYLLKACIEASEVLGVDADERERWREIVAQLAPYPTLDTPAGPVFCDVRDAPRLLDYNITANLVMVLWAEDIRPLYECKPFGREKLSSCRHRSDVCGSC